ncbi:MAG: hypothetical protein ABJO02_13600 [Reichenbachiella sp.]|uniref:hypothetical protein n=1 Tax=Reichenbachiella sp. TaxID=2184521 RepID=UPI00329A16D3
MAKNILLVSLLVVAIVSVIFANRKANEAEIQKLMTLESQVLALENEAKAKEQEKKAIEAASIHAIAKRKVDELERALEVCQ